MRRRLSEADYQRENGCGEAALRSEAVEQLSLSRAARRIVSAVPGGFP